MCVWIYVGFLGSSDSTRTCLQCRRTSFDHWVRKILWRRESLPTPVFLPGESHGQRSLVGYSPLAYKKSDMTECLNTFSHIHTTCIFNKYSISTCFLRTWPLFSKTLLIFSYKLGFFFLVSYFINITGSNLPKFNKPVFFL